MQRGRNVTEQDNGRVFALVEPHATLRVVSVLYHVIARNVI